MKYDPALRWWSVLTVAATSFSVAGLLGELNARDFARQMSAECGLPTFSRQFLPWADSIGLYGVAFAALVIIAALVGFRTLQTEEARYRLLALICTVAWPIVLLGIASFFLAMYALPYAKCAAVA